MVAVLTPARRTRSIVVDARHGRADVTNTRVDTNRPAVSTASAWMAIQPVLAIQPALEPAIASVTIVPRNALIAITVARPDTISQRNRRRNRNPGQADAGTDAGTDTDAGASADTGAGTGTGADADTDAGVNADTDAGADADADAGADADADAGADVDGTVRRRNRPASAYAGAAR